LEQREDAVSRGNWTYHMAPAVTSHIMATLAKNISLQTDVKFLQNVGESAYNLYKMVSKERTILATPYPELEAVWRKAENFRLILQAPENEPPSGYIETDNPPGIKMLEKHTLPYAKAMENFQGSLAEFLDGVSAVLASN